MHAEKLIHEAGGTGLPDVRRYRIHLDPPVPRRYVSELATRIFYVSESIIDFSLVGSGDEIPAVDLTVRKPAGAADGTSQADLARKLRFVVANDLLGQRRPEPKVMWRSQARSEPRDVFDEMTARGIAMRAAEGQVTLGEPAISLMDYFDRRIQKMVTAEFGAREFRYPTMIPAAVMDRCGYFRSFPQLMMLVSRLHADVDSYRAFLNDLGPGQELARVLKSHCADFQYCLPPTMCFHTYHQLADRPLPEPCLAVTSRGKSFRFESRYHRTLERLWDFTIREMVFLGPGEFVLDCRRRVMEWAFHFIESLGLNGYCEVASDPFFIAAGTAQHIWAQQFLELKYELRLPLGAGSDLAVSSFNFHQAFFADAFRITAAGSSGSVPGAPIQTACVGFGLERFTYAFLCQHGLEPAGWPDDVRKAIAT